MIGVFCGPLCGVFGGHSGGMLLAFWWHPVDILVAFCGHGWEHSFGIRGAILGHDLGILLAFWGNGRLQG